MGSFFFAGLEYVLCSWKPAVIPLSRTRRKETLHERVPVAKIRVVLEVQVVLCILGGHQGNIFLRTSFLQTGHCLKSAHSSGTVGWGLYGAPFPSKANTFRAGSPSGFASSASTFDPTMQLTVQLAVGSFHLS